MSEDKTGGPAFPIIVEGGSDSGLHAAYHEGMKLRDFFAAHALTGLMSDPGLRPDNVDEFQFMAMRLYQVADAMIAHRNKDRTDER